MVYTNNFCEFHILLLKTRNSNIMIYGKGRMTVTHIIQYD